MDECPNTIYHAGKMLFTPAILKGGFGVIIVIARIKTRSGRINKIVPLLQANTELGTSKQGHISSFLAKSTENENELLVYSLWDNESLYEQAKKEIKTDPRTKKAMLQLLIHLSGEPVIETFTVIS